MSDVAPLTNAVRTLHVCNYVQNISNKTITPAPDTQKINNTRTPRYLKINTHACEGTHQTTLSAIYKGPPCVCIYNVTARLLLYRKGHELHIHDSTSCCCPQTNRSYTADDAVVSPLKRDRRAVTSYHRSLADTLGA